LSNQRRQEAHNSKIPFWKGAVLLLFHIVEKGKLIVSNVQVEIAIGLALGVEEEFEIPESHLIKAACVLIFLVLPICLETQNDVTRLLQLR